MIVGYDYLCSVFPHSLTYEGVACCSPQLMLMTWALVQ